MFLLPEDAQITPNGGICSMHGAKNQLLCSKEGCTNYVVREGVCMKHGVKLDVQINQGKEECAFGMVRRRNDPALRNAQSQIKLRLVLCV